MFLHVTYGTILRSTGKIVYIVLALKLMGRRPLKVNISAVVPYIIKQQILLKLHDVHNICVAPFKIKAKRILHRAVVDNEILFLSLNFSYSVIGDF